MLHLLPTELLIFIIELTVPPDHASSRYKERQHALRRYCPVCRTMRQVAQPILRRVFRPHSAVTRALGQPGLKAEVQVFEATEPVISSKIAFEVTKKCVNLHDVNIGGWLDKVSAQRLSLLSGVEHLVLRGLFLETRGITFRNLTSLTLHRVANSSKGSLVLTTANFPHLRALYTTSVYYDNETRREQPRDCPDLHPQLDFLQVHHDNAPAFSADLFNRDVTTLLNFSPDSTGDPSTLFHPHLPKHLQFDIFPLGLVRTGLAGQPIPSFHYTHLIQWCAFLRAVVEDSPQLLSLSLPSQLHPPSATTAVVEEACLQLVDLCRERKVTLIWRLNSRTPEDDVGVNREFWAYAKELRRKREAEAAAGVA